MHKTKNLISILVILAVTAIVIVALITANNVQDNDRFSVKGSGVVYAKADIANITIGLNTGVKLTAVEATKESTTKMDSIIKELKGLNIDEKDIKTTNYRLNPSYNWTQKDGQVLKGYEVTQNVVVKIRDLDKIGDVIAKTTEQGANQIGSIAFTIDDEYELKNKARELAIEKAKEKAETMAKQTGMKLGDVKSVYENEASVNAPYAYANAKMEAVSYGGGALESPTIETGQNEIRVEVTLVYEVK